MIYIARQKITGDGLDEAALRRRFMEHADAANAVFNQFLADMERRGSIQTVYINVDGDRIPVRSELRWRLLI